MTKLSRNWVPDAIAVCAALAGLALVAAVAASGDAIGRSVVAIIGGGLAFGLLGLGVNEVVLRRRGRYFSVPSAGVPARNAPAPVALGVPPSFVDATASEFDEGAPAAFAPVVSLTEAQVARQRANERAQEHRATRTRA